MQNNHLLPGYNSIEKLIKDLRTRPESYWLKRGELKVLKLFSEMSRRVPAYKDFLRKSKINPEKIKNTADLKSVPPVDKNNYLKAYPLEKLCWDGKLKEKRWVISSTSGTTGEPFYFPREDSQDQQYALSAEIYLRSNFQIHKKSTLYIDGFAMGAWIGGLFTYEAIKTVAERGNYRLSIITPGTNKPEILGAIQKLAPLFDQVILGGYPPFIKDVIDEGLREGIKWGKYELGFIFSAEGFTEDYRDYIIRHAGLKNAFTPTLNHYGIVDLGTVSHETPLAILIRRLAVKHKTLYKAFFPESHRLPTLTQYLPELFYFENNSDNILISGSSGLPLVRYDVKDRGRVLTFKEAAEHIDRSGINLKREILNNKIGDTVWNLPFVYIYERSDMVVSWSGANIYPEHIKAAHLHKKISPFLTGKFSMEVVTDKKQNPLLHIHSELKKDKQASPELIEDIKKITIQELLNKNSEYHILHSSDAGRMTPKITLWPYESAPYFMGKGKQRWALKTK